MKTVFTSVILCLLFAFGAALLANQSWLSAFDLPLPLLPATLALLTTAILFACHWAIQRLVERLPH